MPKNIEFQIPSIYVKEDCKSVSTQAKEIAQKAMVFQFKHIINTVGKYLRQNKYLVGVSEVNLTRNLRKQLFGLMENFSTLTPEDVDFIGTTGEPTNLTGIL